MDNNVKNKVKLIILLMVFVIISSADIHTSTFLLEILLKKEILFHNIMRNYVEMVEAYSHKVRKYRKRWHHLDYEVFQSLKNESRNLRDRGQNILNLTATNFPS